MTGQQHGRKLHLNAFLMEAGHHEASWRLPASNPRADFDLDHWISLARLAESAKFDSLFLADGPATMGTGEFRPPGQLEPLTLLTALSQATRRIGLIATVSTTYNDPYNLARRLASVDHVSRGRAGWNIVTSAGAEEAANFGLDDRPGHADRYARADEFLSVTKALWDSWEAEAIVADKAAGRYADPARIHQISHRGPYFRVAGPLNVERPPQGYPLLVQAGSSRGRQGLRGQACRGDLHRAPDLRARGRLLRRHQAARSRGRPRPRRRDRAARHRALHRLDRGRGAGPGQAVRRPAGTRVRPAGAVQGVRARAGRLRARRPAARLGAGPAPAGRHAEPVPT